MAGKEAVCLTGWAVKYKAYTWAQVPSNLWACSLASSLGHLSWREALYPKTHRASSWQLLLVWLSVAKLLCESAWFTSAFIRIKGDEKMRTTSLHVQAFDHRIRMAAYSGPRARCGGQYAYQSDQPLSSYCTLAVITNVMTTQYTQEAWCQHLHVTEEKSKSFTASSPSGQLVCQTRQSGFPCISYYHIFLTKQHLSH